ncbi:hypothetical protein [uncultured Rhodospira sp.]|uniref:hypothetical protein n=1 Tax=uncultured Rhodospira sp. TaxID=1936189 RepID=UPI0026256C8C|nr:hypothetical protein [uncultured Rhodospira sp.]
MTRRIRIPFLIDLIRVNDAATIRAVADEVALDRGFEPPLGPLVNRHVFRRVRGALQAPDGPLPSLRRRDDTVRQEAQAALTARLEGDPADLLDDETLDKLAARVRGAGGEAGPLAQQLIGRLFRADYTATAETWDAAWVVQTTAQSNNVVRYWLWLLTGRITRAQKVLSDAVSGDAAGVHATGIAVHNLVDSIERLAALYRDEYLRTTTSTDEVIARALLAPPTTLRQATRHADCLAGSLRPGTLVTFSSREAGTKSLDPRVVFMRDSWSACPAHALVPAMIAAVWTRAVAGQGRAGA